MLILAAGYVPERGGNRQNLVLEGQERNLDTMAIGKVLFVDAAQDGYYRPGKAQNFVDREHIDSIVSAFRGYADVERFAHVADLEEIAGNDYNLNISRYVDTTEPVEVMSVEDALAQLREAERRRDEAVARMDELLAGMGYSR